MYPIRLFVLAATVLVAGCSQPTPSHEPYHRDARSVNADELIASTNALVANINQRLNARERDLVAVMADENLTRLELRANKLLPQCADFEARFRVSCLAHAASLKEVASAAALSIAVMRNETESFELNKEQVETWLATYSQAIDGLEGRIERMGHPDAALAESYPPPKPVHTRGARSVSMRAAPSARAPAAPVSGGPVSRAGTASSERMAFAAAGR